MPFKPLVSKIRVHNPNKKGSAAANRNGVIYIATREGVALDRVNNVNDLIKEKDGNISLKDEVAHQEADDEQYLRYIAKRPRSHGLFGNIDTEDLKQVSSDIANLTKSGKVIYRGIISLGEADSLALGFNNVSSWNNYLKEVMPDVAQTLGISSVDYTWVAAFHAEEKHPHVHYMLWENQDRVKSPYIHVATQNKIRILLEEKMFDNEYQKMIKAIYKDELDLLNQARNDERSYLTENTADIMKEVDYVPGIVYEKLPQRIPKEYLEELAKQTEKLISMLPGKGRMEYAFMPKDVKEQLQFMVDKLLERPDMQSSFTEYMKKVEETHKIYGETRTKINVEMEKAERDIRTRIANRILSEVKENYLVDRAEGTKEQNSVPFMEEPEGVNSVHFTEELEGVNSVHFTEELEGVNSVHFTEELDEVNSVHFTEEPDEVNSVHFIEEMEEQNPVLFTEQDIEEKIIKNYFIEWNDGYKSAMHEIYNDGDLQEAYSTLENEAMQGNALAINEVGKIIERELTDVLVDEAREYYNEALRAFKNVYNTEMKNEYIKEYAAYRIGKLYEFGKGDLDVDFKEAENWYTRANGNKYASYSLAKLYLSEKVYVSDDGDITKNQKCALELLQKSATLKNPFASYELGNMYMKGIGVESNAEIANTYYKEAFDKFLSMTEKSTDDSLFYRIGMMYLNGLGTEINEAEAEKYIKKAVELGNDNAKMKLASMYLERDDIELQKSALELLEELAGKNHDMAQYKLGCIYLNQEMPEYYDMTKAVDYLEKSAKQDNQFAQYKLGFIHSNPEMPEYYDMTKAVDCLEKSAEQDNEYARYRLGCIHSNPELPEYYDMVKAVDYLEKSAEQGNQFAQYKLGCIHSNPEMPEYYDMPKAMDYLEKSAEQGNQFAQYKLGCIHSNPELPEYYDMVKAVDYLEKSADQGNQFAQYKLGCIHLDQEIPEYYDMTKAVDYLEKSAEQGNQFAQYKLGCIHSDQEIPEYYDMPKAMDYLEKSAEQGNQFAQYKLGCIHSDQEIPEYYDMPKAMDYLEKSAEQGNQFAQYKLGCIHSNPEMPEYYDMTKAVDYLEKSAEQGNQFAQYKLGCIHLDQEKPEYYDMAKAVDYLEKSAKQGNQFAQCRLGVMYYFGKDVPVDKEIGRYWLTQSANQGNEFAKTVLEQPEVGIDFAYCLLKGVLSSMETFNRQQAQEQLMIRTQSRQAMKEAYLHSDMKKEHETD